MRPRRAADRDRAADVPGGGDLLRPRLGCARGFRRAGARARWSPIGSERSAARRAERRSAAPSASRSDCSATWSGTPSASWPRATGLALQRGELGAWLVGEQGALLVRSGGRRVDCWCVRVGDGGELPAGDRVAHLLLALREDELGFAKVANLGFSGGGFESAVS